MSRKASPAKAIGITLLSGLSEPIGALLTLVFFRNILTQVRHVFSSMACQSHCAWLSFLVEGCAGVFHSCVNILCKVAVCFTFKSSVILPTHCRLPQRFSLREYHYTHYCLPALTDFLSVVFPYILILYSCAILDRCSLMVCVCVGNPVT